MTITNIGSVSQLNGILEKSKDKLSVIDFHATCGISSTLCWVILMNRQIKLHLPTRLSLGSTPMSISSSVTWMLRARSPLYTGPTFIFLLGSTKVDQIRGANRAGLEAAIRKHSSPSAGSSDAFSGKGQTLGGESAEVSREPSASLFSNMNPQVRVLLYLLGAYLLFWYLK
ncbi:hypothetical protein D9757_004686 [Collybiopsis confluens]|uniref:Uncharacterized protein n=1 Tax=Collybiopsis confluens TaxID=2823264 RepID=A0A8H5MC65_9AGAR|nr:hypothetical protein D9757_004686 [Collybiopsis confluens]